MTPSAENGLPLALSHYTALDVLEPRSVAQDSGRGFKPSGLWVSVDGPDDWRAWCEGEGWGLDRLRHRFVVTLTETARLLVITSPDELRAFDAEFGESGQRSWHVAWDAVAREWQGIIIAPYLWECRLSDPAWYYCWDCASGCIWDASAIASVALLETCVPPPAGGGGS